MIAKDYLPALGLLLCCFLCSCFQVIEEVNVQENGSGTASLTLNLSASKAKVASLMLLDSAGGYKVPSRQKIQQEIGEVVAYLKKTKGISNVQKKIDFENFIASVSFSFEHISNINNLNQTVLKKLKVNVISNSSYSYEPESGIFQRNYTYAKEAILQYNKLKPEARNVFKEASYTSIYRFGKPIASYSNTLGKLSKSKKAIMLNTSVMGLINGKTNISNTIVLTK